jgi:parallel beta-helix repeat protein
LVGGVSLFMAPAARAAVTRVVDDDGKATVANCGAATVARSSIQVAIDDSANGDVVKVCPGQYGRIFIDKPLTLNGPQAGVNATVRSFNAATEAVISSGNSSDNAVDFSTPFITFDGFTVEKSSTGINAAIQSGGLTIKNNLVRGNVVGMELDSGGANPNVVTRNRFSWNNGTGTFSGPEGVGILSQFELMNTVIRANGFLGHRLGAILLLGCGFGVTQNVQLLGNSFKNDGFGIAAITNATSLTVQQNKYDNPAGIGEEFRGGIFLTPTVTNSLVGGPDRGNTVTNAPVGIAVLPEAVGFCAPDAVPPGPIVIRNNDVSNSGDAIRVDADRTAVARVVANTVSNNDVGIRFGPETDGNTIKDNTASASSSVDCLDESTGGAVGAPNYTTQNSWVNNIGALASPAGICT